MSPYNVETGIRMCHFFHFSLLNNKLSVVYIIMLQHFTSGIRAYLKKFFT